MIKQFYEPARLQRADDRARRVVAIIRDLSDRIGEMRGELADTKRWLAEHDSPRYRVQNSKETERLAARRDELQREIERLEAERSQLGARGTLVGGLAKRLREFISDHGLRPITGANQ